MGYFLAFLQIVCRPLVWLPDSSNREKIKNNMVNTEH